MEKDNCIKKNKKKIGEKSDRERDILIEIK